MPPFNLFTPKGQSAVHRSHEIALERGQTQVHALHLLLSLLTQDDSPLQDIFEEMDFDSGKVAEELASRLEDKGDGGAIFAGSTAMYLTGEFSETLDKASHISKEMNEKRNSFW